MSYTMQAQNRFGLEIRTSRHITSNTKEVFSNCCFVTIMDVTDYISNSVSVGFMYQLSASSAFKLHFGKHHNGLVGTLTYYTDTGISLGPQEADVKYTYLQITPSFAYQVSSGRHLFPIEIGINVNKWIKAYEVYFGTLKKYNFDIRFSAGYAYTFTNELSLGLNFFYAKALDGYTDDMYVVGEFLPEQKGLELSLKYFLKKGKEK